MMRPLLLLLLAAPALAAQPKKMPPDAERGEELWERSCWHCHGEEGAGDGPAAAAFPDGVPDLTDGRIEASRYEDYVEIVLEGSGTMPAFGTEFNRHEARRILVYLDTLDDEEPDERPDEEPGDAPDGAPAPGEGPTDQAAPPPSKDRTSPEEDAPPDVEGD